MSRKKDLTLQLVIGLLLLAGVAWGSGLTVSSGGGSASINDSAGNGDTTYVWSADKVYDQLALKLNATALDDTKGNGDTTYIWSADKVFDQLALKLTISDIDDAPVDSVTNAPISSNWAYDHAALTTAHGITAAAATVLDDATVADMVNTLGGATSTGTGGLVRIISPTLTTPTLGAAIGTSIQTANNTDATTFCLKGYRGDSSAQIDALCVENETAASGDLILKVMPNVAFQTGTLTIATDSIGMQAGTTAGDHMSLGAYNTGVTAYRELVKLESHADSPFLSLYSEGLITMGGVGDTNNENLTFDFETTADTVGIASTTGVTGISFGSLNLVTTGTISGAIPSTTDNNGQTLSAAQQYGYMHWATGAGTTNLVTAVAGMNFCVYSTTAAAVVINPADADVITLNGTALSAGDSITSASGAGDFICLMSQEAGKWVTLGRSGTWTDTN